MEPELPTPRFNPEQTPDRRLPEEGLQPVERVPDHGLERAAERFERRAESGAGAADRAAVSLPTPVPVAADPASDTNQPSVHDDGIPAVANDDDLIEKEWVSKAKRILSETKDDPYRREEEISRLQQEYLRKRYGKELGAPK